MIGPNLTNDRGYPARWDELYTALGLDPNKHLPDEGVRAKMLSNVVVFVWPKQFAASEAKRSANVFKHRLRCWCPKCSKELSAGRLHQHLKTCKGARR